MRLRGCPVLWGMAIGACLWLISCTSPATPTAEPQTESPTRGPTLTQVSPSNTPTPGDTSAPQVKLEPLPEVVRPAEGLKIVAAASDNRAVARMALVVDGVTLYQVAESSLRYNLDTRALSATEHRVAVQAWDTDGNMGLAQAEFVLEAVTPSPSPNASATGRPAPSPVPSTTMGPSATAEPTATAAPSATPLSPVIAYWDAITIATYGYQGALYTDPSAGYPYPRLHWEQVTGATPQTYQVLVLRNEYLQLTLLPALGGRIYQCRYLPTGQDLLYNNRVIKPTHWGPADQGWWLAVGGIEF